MPESGRAREVVDRLLRAEGRATARLAEADARARERLEQAARDAQRRRVEAGERAQRDHEDSLERARYAAEAQAAARLERVEASWRALADASRPRLAGAVERVVAWVCGEGAAGEPP